MPVQHVHTVRAGARGVSVLVHARDGSGRGVTGLSARSPGAAAGWCRAGEPAAALDLDGSLTEVDADLVPGVYQLDLPDAVVAEGSDRAMVVLRFDDAVVDPVDLHLVAYDPQDGVRMGVTGLADDSRHEFLRRALPKLTEEEFRLGVEREQALRRQKGST